MICWIRQYSFPAHTAEVAQPFQIIPHPVVRLSYFILGTTADRSRSQPDKSIRSSQRGNAHIWLQLCRLAHRRQAKPSGLPQPWLLRRESRHRLAVLRSTFRHHSQSCRPPCAYAASATLPGPILPLQISYGASSLAGGYRHICCSSVCPALVRPHLQEQGPTSFGDVRDYGRAKRLGIWESTHCSVLDIGKGTFLSASFSYERCRDECSWSNKVILPGGTGVYTEQLSKQNGLISTSSNPNYLLRIGLHTYVFRRTWEHMLP
jgi:hypothetical protein